MNLQNFVYPKTYRLDIIKGIAHAVKPHYPNRSNNNKIGKKLLCKALRGFSSPVGLVTDKNQS